MARVDADPAHPPDGLNQLDPLLQHRTRLGALVLLSRVDAMNFSRLKSLLDETDGNLGAQLKKLEDARYVGVKKEFAYRKPVTWYALSAEGKKALKLHLTAMENLIKAAGPNR